MVKEFIIAEKRYLRDLHMITKVFRDLLIKYHLATPLELEKIFSNINDVTELTLTLIGSMEDTLEMTEQGNVPAVGTCFEELAEVNKLLVLASHSSEIRGLLSTKCSSEMLQNLLYFILCIRKPM